MGRKRKSEDMMDQAGLVRYGLEQDIYDLEGGPDGYEGGASLEYLQEVEGARPLSAIYREQQWDEWEAERFAEQVARLEAFDQLIEPERLLTEDERLIEESIIQVDELYSEYYFDESKLKAIQKRLDRAGINWDTIREITKSEILFLTDWEFDDLNG